MVLLDGTFIWHFLEAPCLVLLLDFPVQATLQIRLNRKDTPPLKWAYVM